MQISRKKSTHKNYDTWLTPFVDWLEEQAKVRPVVVTSLTIRDYLQQHRKYKTAESYDRAGAQIVQFVNQYVTDKVHHLKGLGFDLHHDNINMPEEYIERIDEWLRDRLVELQEEASSVKHRREMSKIFGK